MVKLIFKHKFIGLKNIQTMEYYNFLNINKISVGEVKSALLIS